MRLETLVLYIGVDNGNHVGIRSGNYRMILVPVTERIGGNYMKRNLIDLATVIAISGHSRPTIYRHMDKGIFPRQIQCQDGRVRWYLFDIIRWCIRLHPELFGSDVAGHPRRKLKRLGYAGTSSHYDFRSERRPRHLRKIGEVPEDSPRVRQRMPEYE